jgi:hypothetical protein
MLNLVVLKLPLGFKRWMAWCLVKHIDSSTFAFTNAVINAEREYVITAVKNGLNLAEVQRKWDSCENL